MIVRQATHILADHALEHDPEKWLPVFPRDKREAFARRSCANKKVERDDDSKKSHPALTARSALTSRVFRWAMATHSFMLRERIEFAASGREITVKG
jgi:hypothetical protein